MSSANVASVVRRPGRLQFNLRQLIAATVWCSVGLALITQWGEEGVWAFWLLSSTAALCYGTYWVRWVWLATGILGFTIAGCASMLPSVCGGCRTPTRRSQCSNNLKQVVLALQNYHDTYNTFPPAYIADKNGRPMHSWRVLILPFCEQQGLFNAYDFSEPWNGPNNSKLLDRTPPYLFCPSETGSPQLMETSYLAVTGPGTAWPGTTPTNFAQITDGTSNTLLVVEVHNSGVHWMEPRDLHILQMPMTINAPRGPGIRSSHVKAAHPSGANAGFADGRVQFLTNETPPETLRALFTIAGGEQVTLP